MQVSGAAGDVESRVQFDLASFVGRRVGGSRKLAM